MNNYWSLNIQCSTSPLHITSFRFTWHKAISGWEEIFNLLLWSPLLRYLTPKCPVESKTWFSSVLFILPHYDVGKILWNCENYGNALLVWELFEKTTWNFRLFWWDGVLACLVTSPGVKLVNSPIRKSSKPLCQKQIVFPSQLRQS